MKIEKKKLLYFFFELSPFADLTLKICNHNILKTIIGTKEGALNLVS